MKNNTTLSKQNKIIIGLGAAAVVFAVVYVIFLITSSQQKQTLYLYDSDGDIAQISLRDNNKERLEKDSAITLGYINKVLDGAEVDRGYNIKKGETPDVLCTLEADDLEISYRYYVYPECSSEDIKYVSVKNVTGEYVIEREKAGDSFIIPGYEGLLYSSDKISALTSSLSCMLSAEKRKVGKDKHEEYCLTEEKCEATVEMKTFDGDTNKLYIGCLDASGSYRYVKHSKKDCVYLIYADEVEAVFADVKEYINPVIEKSIPSEEVYYVEKFTLTRQGSKIISFELIPDALTENNVKGVLHRIVHPESQIGLSTTMVYENVLPYLCSPMGTEVLELKFSENEQYNELSEIYGLDEPYAVIDYTFGGVDRSIKLGKNDEVQSGYFAHSDYMDTVVFLPLEYMPFAEYDYIEFVQDRIFFEDIEGVKKITVQAKGETRVFNLTGSKDQLKVTEQGGKAIDVPSFRQFYIALLDVGREGYSQFDESTNLEELEHNLTFEIQFKTGDKHTYSFYTESSLRCYCVFNGTGQFYTKREVVNRIIQYTDMLMNGEIIRSRI